MTSDLLAMRPGFLLHIAMKFDLVRELGRLEQSISALGRSKPVMTPQGPNLGCNVKDAFDEGIEDVEARSAQLPAARGTARVTPETTGRGCATVEQGEDLGRAVDAKHRVFTDVEIQQGDLLFFPEDNPANERRPVRSRGPRHRASPTESAGAWGSS